MAEKLPIEVSVGNTTGGNAVRLTSANVPCSEVIVYPPAATPNGAALYVVVSGLQQTHVVAVKGRYIDPAAFEGIRVKTGGNANQVWIAGTNAGDKAIGVPVR